MSTQPRIGRPPKKVVGKSRSGINFNINAQLRRELVEAAQAANRSLGAQIEWCISYALAAEKMNARMARRVQAYKDGTLPSPFSEEATQGPLSPELMERFAKVDRGVTPQQLDEKLQAERELTDERLRKLREEITQDLANALLKPQKRDDAA